MTALQFPIWTDALGNQVFTLEERVYTRIGLLRVSNAGVRQVFKNGVWVNI